VLVAWLDVKDQEFKIKFKYTSYQLWESALKGFLSSFNQDFIILSKEGMSYVRLDPNLPRRSMQRRNQGQMMIHSLSSMNYLKIEPGNMLNFEN
jgi:hypothetical protein